MSLVVVDANVLLTHVTEREPRQQRLALDLFARAASDEIELVLCQVSLSEIVYVLESFYQLPSEEVARLVGDIFRQRGLEIGSQVVWSRVLELWPAEVKDFADAVVLAVALERRAPQLATFDRTLARVAARHGVRSAW